MPGVIFSIFYLGQVRTRLVGMKVRTFGLLSLFRVVVTLACLVWALMYPWANERKQLLGLRLAVLYRNQRGFFWKRILKEVTSALCPSVITKGSPPKEVAENT